MTQLNINVMDMIVDNLAAGMTISKALEAVYTKRKVAIPYDDKFANVSIDDLDMTKPVRNVLKRTHIYTVGDIVKFGEANDVKSIRNMGYIKCIEMMESLLNYAWDHMSIEKRDQFLIDTVTKNSGNIRNNALQASQTR